MNRKAIALDSLNLVHYFNLGVEASYAGRWDAAEAAGREVLELNPVQPGSGGAST